jgi:hypothetical protein
VQPGRNLNSITMPFLTHWILPIAFVVVGIAILAGWMFPHLPEPSGLRLILGIVTVLLGVHRFVASRTMSRANRRRFGGERQRPWE